MHAPSPAGMVVNEYYDWAAADFTGCVGDQAPMAPCSVFTPLAPRSPRAFGDSTFALPASPACNSTNMTGVEAVRWVRDHFPLFLPEVVAAAPRAIWAKI